MLSRTALRASAPTAAFVLLWSSGHIVSEVGLWHGSPFALLVVRLAVALVVLSAVALRTGRLLPARASWPRVVLVGALISGVYSISYLLALEHGITPGALATILGVQPILTALVTERRVGPLRLLGLLCALAGLTLVVWDGLVAARFTALGLGLALLSLLGMTLGSLAQKRETQAPSAVLPMQYAVGLALCGAVVPFGPFHASWSLGFVLPALWLALGISVGATLLLYRLIARGNLVNVTSVFYLVPGVTALLDWLLLGHPMSVLSTAGLASIVAGLALVLRPESASSARPQAPRHEALDLRAEVSAAQAHQA